jgi:hypothetical protein
MWILQLNPMTANFENLSAVARAETREQLVAFLLREQVEPYTDDDGENMCGGKLRKSFRKGGPLEYLNPPDRPECFVEVSLDKWLEQTRLEYERRVMSIMSV